MATKRNLVETSVSGKTEPDPSVLPEITGLLILAFGGVWFLFLRGAIGTGKNANALAFLV
jgi:hypothetical protein